MKRILQDSVLQARSSGKISGGPMAAFLYPDPFQLKRNNVSVKR